MGGKRCCKDIGWWRARRTRRREAETRCGTWPGAVEPSPGLGRSGDKSRERWEWGEECRERERQSNRVRERERERERRGVFKRRAKALRGSVAKVSWPESPQRIVPLLYSPLVVPYPALPIPFVSFPAQSRIRVRPHRAPVVPAQSVRRTQGSLTAGPFIRHSADVWQINCGAGLFWTWAVAAAAAAHRFLFCHLNKQTG